MVVVPCPRLVGREGEVATLGQALTAAADRQGTAIVLTGEAGVGKSRLLRELSDEAGRRGVPVFSGRAVEATSPLPFRPLAEAFFSHLRQGEWRGRPGLAPFESALARLAPGWAPGAAGTGDASTVVVGEAVLRLLGVAGERCGCVLALEDLHWADPETIDVVEYLADNLAEEPLLCVATVRDDEPTEAVRKLNRLVVRRALRAISVGRLDPAGVQAMAVACLAGDDALAAGRVSTVARAEGLPFLVEELLVAADAGGPDSDATPVPEGFRATVRRRVGVAPGLPRCSAPRPCWAVASIGICCPPSPGCPMRR